MMQDGQRPAAWRARTSVQCRGESLVARSGFMPQRSVLFGTPGKDGWNGEPGLCHT